MSDLRTAQGLFQRPGRSVLARVLRVNSESADFVLVDTLCNMRQCPDGGNSEQDWFNADDMKAFVRRPWAGLKIGGHGHVFCTALKFGQRSWALSESLKREILCAKMNGRVYRRWIVG